MHVLVTQDVVIERFEIADTVRCAGEIGVDGDRHHARNRRPFLIEAVKVVAAPAEDFVGRLQLDRRHHHIVDFDRVGNGNQLAGLGLDAYRLIVEHPVGDVFDPGGSEQVGGVVSFGDAGAFPAARRLAGEFADGVNGLLDCQRLIFDLVHRFLHKTVAHEIPAGGACGFAGGAVNLDRRAIDGERCLDVACFQHFDKAPEADAHAVLVPGPVGNVRQQRLTHRRRQHGTRHRAGRLPVFNVNDCPHGHPGVTRQFERRPADDRFVGDTLAHTHADFILTHIQLSLMLVW